jgi:signal transduction histidine kinase
VRLVDDLMDVSRISRGKLELRRERVDLARAVIGAVETSRPAVDQAGHDLTVGRCRRVDPGTRWTPTRPGWPRCSNLLNNAAKYTDRGGRVRLAAGRDGAAAAVTVADDGIGIPPAMLRRVFDMFTQVDRTLRRPRAGWGSGCRW